jgi:hypothetical protein
LRIEDWGLRIASSHLQSCILNPQSFFPGFPTAGLGRATVDEGADAGSFSFGSERERENAPLAERCLPTLGLRIAPW